MSGDNLDPFAFAGQGEPQLEDDGELRARAEALAAEYGAPLPEGDAGLIEAERRIREFKPRAKALHRDFKITMESETQILEPIVYEAEFELHDFIGGTPPETRAGAIVKLRYLLGHGNLLLNGAEEPLEQILALLEREAQR
jgi:hypothetical protein